MDSELITISLAIFVLSVLLFFLIPNALDLFSFSGKMFYKGEYWRLFSFNFVHVDLVHLIINIITLGITMLLALELGLSGNFFIGLFIITTTSIALIEGIAFPFLILAGISLGVYSVLGGLSIKGKNFVPLYVFVPLVLFATFLNTKLFCKDCFDSSSLLQGGFHFAGFFGGIFVYKNLRKYIKKKKRIFLRGDNLGEG